jgi:hypothetical protein
MPKSLLELSAELRLAIYDYLVPAEGLVVDLRTVACLRLCCRAIKHELDYEFIHATRKITQGISYPDKLGHLFVKAPRKFLETAQIEVSISFADMIATSNYDTSWPTHFCNQLPDQVRKIRFHVRAKHDSHVQAGKGSYPEWYDLFFFCEELSTTVGKGLQLGVSWTKYATNMSRLECGSTMEKFAAEEGHRVKKMGNAALVTFKFKDGVKARLLISPTAPSEPHLDEWMEIGPPST